MRNKLFLTLLFFCVCSLQLFAHGYWLEVEGANKTGKSVTVKMFYGDYPVGERLSGKTLDKMKDIRVYVVAPSGEKQPVAMTQYNDYWQGSFIPQQKGSYEVIGINEEREVQDWTKHHLGITRPVQYLKAFYQVGKKTELASVLFLDAQIRKISKGNFEITILKDGKPLPSQKFTIAEFDKGEAEFITGTSGSMAIKLENSGRHILSVDWIDTNPGTFKGKGYETVRHRLDITVVN